MINKNNQEEKNKIFKKFMTRRKLRKYLKNFLNKKVYCFYEYFNDGWYHKEEKMKLFQFHVKGETPIQTGDIECDCQKFAFQSYEIYLNNEYFCSISGESRFIKHKKYGLIIMDQGDCFYLKRRLFNM